MANKLKDTTPRPRIGKTAKDTRVARLIDINKVVDEVNEELFVIEGEQVIQDMRLTNLEADVAVIPPAPTTAIVNISSAQILAMGTTPIELLPAPGANKYYDIEKVILEFDYQGTVYDVSGINYISLVGVSSYLYAGWLASNKDQVSIIKNRTMSTDASLQIINETAPINFEVQLSTDTTLDPTLGTGTIRAIITYTERTLGA